MNGIPGGLVESGDGVTIIVKFIIAAGVDRNVDRKPSLVGGVKGHDIK